MTATHTNHTRVRLSAGNWIGIATIAITLVGGLIDVRVQLATLNTEVAQLTKEVDRLARPQHMADR